MKKVFIVVLTYKGDKETTELLDSLLQISLENISVNTVVIDNYPKEPFKTEVSKYGSIGLEIISSQKNLGFSGGNNKGIEYALSKNADYVVVLNNDTVVHRDFLVELIKSCEEKPDAGIVAPKIYFEKGYEYHKDRYKENEKGNVIWYAGGEFDWQNILAKHKGVDEVDTGQFSKVVETEFASGCCFLTSSEVLKKIGRFDEKYFLYYEDSDLSVRARRSGYKIYLNPKSVVWHKNASSSGGSGSDLQDYYITRNRLLFAVKYASVRAKTAVIKEGFRLLLAGRPWQKQGVLDFFLRKFGRGSFPIS